MNIVADCFVDTITIIDPSICGADLFVRVAGLDKKCLGQITKKNGKIFFKQSAILSFKIPYDYQSQEIPLIFSAERFSSTFEGKVDLNPGIEAAERGVPSIVSSVVQLRKQEGRIGCEMSVKYCLDFSNKDSQVYSLVTDKRESINNALLLNKELEMRETSPETICKPLVEVETKEVEILSNIFNDDSDDIDISSTLISTAASAHENSESICVDKGAKKPEEEEEEEEEKKEEKKENVPEVPKIDLSPVKNDARKPGIETPLPQVKRSSSSVGVERKTEMRKSNSSTSLHSKLSPRVSSQSTNNGEHPLIISQSVRQGLQWKKGNKPDVLTSNNPQSTSPVPLSSLNSTDEGKKETESQKPLNQASQQPRVEFDVPSYEPKKIDGSEESSSSGEFF